MPEEYEYALLRWGHQGKASVERSGNRRRKPRIQGGLRRGKVLLGLGMGGGKRLMLRRCRLIAFNRIQGNEQFPWGVLGWVYRRLSQPGVRNSSRLEGVEQVCKRWFCSGHVRQVERVGT